MFQARVVYTDRQESVLEFERKPSIDIKGNHLVLDSNGQKLFLNANTFLVVKLSYPSPTTVKPFKYQSTTQYNTKNNASEVLMHCSEPKAEIKLCGNNGLLFMREDEQVLRIINGEWYESIKIELFTEESPLRKR